MKKKGLLDLVDLEEVKTKLGDIKVVPFHEMVMKEGVFTPIEAYWIVVCPTKEFLDKFIEKYGSKASGKLFTPLCGILLPEDSKSYASLLTENEVLLKLVGGGDRPTVAKVIDTVLGMIPYNQKQVRCIYAKEYIGNINLDFINSEKVFALDCIGK